MNLYKAIIYQTPSASPTEVYVPAKSLSKALKLLKKAGMHDYSALVLVCEKYTKETGGFLSDA